MTKYLIDFIRAYYGTNDFIPLHQPTFNGFEQHLVADTIKSTFVSSVGEYVTQFEKDIANYTGAENAIATVNGTAALHTSLMLAGVQASDCVITQPLTFVATCNAISYCQAEPIFIDVDLDTLSLSASALETWLEDNALLDDDGFCRRRTDKKIIRACVPMHTFGHPADLSGIVKVTKKWNIQLVEDAAESLGSFYRGQHTGTFGSLAAVSFNGNKIITTGGGGAILTDHTIAHRAKHLTTTAKQPHDYEYVHDEIGYNYRLPNLNAALGCAQLSKLEGFVQAKRHLANAYQEALAGTNLLFVKEPLNCRSNYWLNAVLCEDKAHRDAILQETNKQGVMTRPIWNLMNKLIMYKNCQKGDLSKAEWLAERIVNLPSSVRIISDEC